jgi:hypothetical protein
VQRTGWIAAGEPHHVLALFGEAGHQRIDVALFSRAARSATDQKLTRFAASEVEHVMGPKIRDGLLDEATTWEEWYFQPIW